MKLTKAKLQKIIKEELRNLAEEGGPQVEWEISHEDGRVFARGMDPDTFEGDNPLEVELDPVKLYAAIDSGELELEKERGPEAGSMPMSQSPAYSDEEKASIKKRRIGLGYGHEYDE